MKVEQILMLEASYIHFSV